MVVGFARNNRQIFSNHFIVLRGEVDTLDNVVRQKGEMVKVGLSLLIDLLHRG